MDQSIIESGSGGWMRRTDGSSARVTYRQGSWGYWSNGRRVEPFPSPEEAIGAFLDDSEIKA